uniref:Putative secreted protein n=1 Tax=Xenopsylla cheopis TaxID=163159 RepID=A0A6M2DVP4_XENCH
MTRLDILLQFLICSNMTIAITFLVIRLLCNPFKKVCIMYRANRLLVSSCNKTLHIMCHVNHHVRLYQLNQDGMSRHSLKMELIMFLSVYLLQLCQKVSVSHLCLLLKTAFITYLDNHHQYLKTITTCLVRHLYT